MMRYSLLRAHEIIKFISGQKSILINVCLFLIFIATYHQQRRRALRTRGKDIFAAAQKDAASPSLSAKEGRRQGLTGTMMKRE